MKIASYTNTQIGWLVIMRILVGWHFLYEGIAKILQPGWSAYPYLMDSQGFFAGFFHSLAADPTLLSVVNILNMAGLTVIGLSLILGFFSRPACIGGILFLLLFYLSHPPFIGARYMMPAEGSYLWIDKNIIEIVILVVLYYFPTSHIIGLDRYLDHFSLKLSK